MGFDVSEVEAGLECRRRCLAALVLGQSLVASRPPGLRQSRASCLGGRFHSITSTLELQHIYILTTGY